VACSDRSGSQDLITITQTLATNPETSPYFDCFFLETPEQEKIRQSISRQAPRARFWETVCVQDEQPSGILSCLVENNPFARPGTSVLVIPTKWDSTKQFIIRYLEHLRNVPLCIDEPHGMGDL
jgi:hypothetical protein